MSHLGLKILPVDKSIGFTPENIFAFSSCVVERCSSGTSSVFIMYYICYCGCTSITGV